MVQNQKDNLKYKMTGGQKMNHLIILELLQQMVLKICFRILVSHLKHLLKILINNNNSLIGIHKQ